MSQNLKDLAARLYADAAAGNHKSFLDALADDAIICVHGAAPHAGKYTGKAGFMEVMGKAHQTSIEEKRTIDKMIGNEDTVVVIGYEEFTVIPTGKRAKGPFVHHVTFRDGRITLFEDFEVAGADAWA